MKTIELKLFMAYAVLTYGLVEISHSFTGNVLLLPSCRATPLVMVQHCSGQALGCTPDQAEFAKTAQFFLVFSKPVKSLPVFLFSLPRCRADSNCAGFFREFD